MHFGEIYLFQNSPPDPLVPRLLLLTGISLPSALAAPASVSSSSSLLTRGTWWRFVCFHITSSCWSPPRTGHFCFSSATPSSRFANRRLLRSFRLVSLSRTSLQRWRLVVPTTTWMPLTQIVRSWEDAVDNLVVRSLSHRRCPTPSVR